MGARFYFPMPTTDDPVLPPPAYDLGVAGWDHRYLASDLELGDVVSWPDRGSSPRPLTRFAGDSGTIQNILDTGENYVRFSAPEGLNARLSDNISLAADTRTVAVIMRYAQGTAASVMTFMSAHGLSINRPSNQQMQLNGAGTGIILISGAATVGPWRIVIFGIDTPLLAVGSTEVTTGTPWSPSGSGPVVVGSTGGTAGAGTRLVDVAEIVQFPKVLNSTERNTLRASMAAQYAIV